MKHVKPTTAILAGWALLLGAVGAGGQDWPQWRGPNRDAKATGFTAPKMWPKELTQKWKGTVVCQSASLQGKSEKPCTAHRSAG